MVRSILPDVETFEFVTSLGKRLDLHGTLVAWSDRLIMGLAEHQILKRDGAIHQNMGARPRIFSFACVLLGKDLTVRYKALIDTLEEDPTGTLIHPRFGSLPAMCRDISAGERPADELSTIRFTLEFVQTGLRSLEKPNAEALAAAAMDVMAGLVANSSPSTVLARPTANLQASTFAYQQKANQFLQGQVTTSELGQVLQSIRTGINALRAISGLSYRIKAQAALVFSNILASYNAAVSSRPPVVSFLISGSMSIHRLCASLYGGKHAKAMVQELLNLNRIPNPYHIPAGTLLLLSDPTMVKTNAR